MRNRSAKSFPIRVYPCPSVVKFRVFRGFLHLSFLCALRCLLFCLFVTAFLSCANAGTFKEFYVSPVGSDANPGTKAKPFLTLARARDAVRSVNRQMKGDIIVYLRGGTYAVSAPVEFTAADSGFTGF